MARPAKENFKSIFQLSTLNAFDPDSGMFEKVKNPIPVVHNTTLLGVEIEVEGLQSMKHWPDELYCQYKDDGSLRNCGKEFITYPTRSQDIQQVLEMIYTCIPPNASFSKRTSVHVHLNMRVFTKQQLFSLTLAYLITEKLLFNFVGQNRDQNIHCVPLQECSIMQNLQPFFTGKQRAPNWMKYSALNFCCLQTLGTIEFRHMHGTRDIKKLMQWINFILSLKVYAYFNKPDIIIEQIKTLNTTSHYLPFLQSVYGEHTEELLKYSPNYMRDMEFGVSLAKELIDSNIEVQKLMNKIGPDSPVCLCYTNPYLQIKKSAQIDAAILDNVVKEVNAKVNAPQGWNAVELEAIINPPNNV